METERLLDQGHKFVVLGPDEGIWYFVWESTNNIFSWYAYRKPAGEGVYVPVGPWSEVSVFRFLKKHMRRLTDSDRIDLHLYLHKGGIEKYLRKNRIDMKGVQ